ncbi:hypothetical protein Tco_1438165 [Tanacetum coccineum]
MGGGGGSVVIRPGPFGKRGWFESRRCRSSVLVIVAVVWVIPRDGPIAGKTRSYGVLALPEACLETCLEACVSLVSSPTVGANLLIQTVGRSLIRLGQRKGPMVLRRSTKSMLFYGLRQPSSNKLPSNDGNVTVQKRVQGRQTTYAALVTTRKTFTPGDSGSNHGEEDNKRDCYLLQLPRAQASGQALTEARNSFGQIQGLPDIQTSQTVITQMRLIKPDASGCL